MTLIYDGFSEIILYYCNVIFSIKVSKKPIQHPKSKQPSAVNIAAKHYYLISFIEGAMVMAVEILAGKILSMYYGNSLIVWTPILGVTLAGLTIGYFIGGILSNKYPQKSTLFYVVLCGAVFSGILPFWSSDIMTMNGDLGHTWGATVSAIMFLLPTLICMGAVSPIIINHLSKEISQSGKSAGNVYAISTVGGIIATFITGFVILPNFGVKVSLVSFTALFGVIPFIYFIKRKKVIIPTSLIVFLLFTTFFGTREKSFGTGKKINVLHSSEGLMGHLFVGDDVPLEKRSLLINYISQTFMHVPTKRSQWRYIHRLALYSSHKPPGSEVLICGLGGGNLVNEMANLQFKIDAVELDERMAILAKEFFFMTDIGLKTFVDDARHYIRTCEKKYDIIILDMSAGENQPANVYTETCFKEIYKLLNDDGILFLHYQNVLEGEHSIAVKSLGKTLQAAGFIVKPLNTQNDWKNVSEIILFSSKSEMKFNPASFNRRDKFADPFGFPMDENMFLENYDFSEGMILSDDKPIMDLLHSNTLFQSRGATIESTFPIFFHEDIELY